VIKYNQVVFCFDILKLSGVIREEGNNMAMPLRVVRKKIGELLIERHIITQEQLSIALEQQKKKGGYLSQHLITLGFATEMNIAICLSNQYNFAYIPLKNYSIDKKILKLIPLKWIKIYTLLPLDKIGNILTIAMADPLNEGVIQMLSQITDCEIITFISTFSELTEAINMYFEKELKDLEKIHMDAKDIEKTKTINQFIQTKPYSGPDRREYVRVRKELDIFFYYYAITFRGKTKDISYGGVSFISDEKDSGGVSFFSGVFMPLNTSLACKIYLKSGLPPINAVINVLRIQAVRDETKKDSQRLSGQSYEIAGMFEFIANEDREALVSFLKENIP